MYCFMHITDQVCSRFAFFLVRLLQKKLASLVRRVHHGFEDAVQTLMHLNALVECTNLHKEFVDGIDGICHRGL